MKRHKVSLKVSDANEVTERNATWPFAEKQLRRGQVYKET